MKKRKKLMKIRIKKITISNIPTQCLSTNPIKVNDNNKDYFYLINIDLNLYRHKEYIPIESHIILNNYTFEEAKQYGQRQLCLIFYIFALSKQIFFHTFLFRSPLELLSLRFCLFIFIISSDLALNALFYFNDNISKKYKYAKNLFLFTFNNNITVILLSTFVGFLLLTLLAKLSNSINNIRQVFIKEEEKKEK